MHHHYLCNSRLKLRLYRVRADLQNAWVIEIFHKPFTRKQAGQKQVDQLNARRDKALLWFQNCYTTEGLSFPWVCEALDFNPFFIFQTLKKQGLIPKKLFYQPKGKCPWPDVIYFKTPDELAAVLNSQLGLFPATH